MILKPFGRYPGDLAIIRAFGDQLFHFIRPAVS
jgi:hypothetical protein